MCVYTHISSLLLFCMTTVAFAILSYHTRCIIHLSPVLIGLALDSTPNDICFHRWPDSWLFSVFQLNDTIDVSFSDQQKNYVIEVLLHHMKVLCFFPTGSQDKWNQRKKKTTINYYMAQIVDDKSILHDKRWWHTRIKQKMQQTFKCDGIQNKMCVSQLHIYSHISTGKFLQTLFFSDDLVFFRLWVRNFLRIMFVHSMFGMLMHVPVCFQYVNWIHYIGRRCVSLNKLIQRW